VLSVGVSSQVLDVNPEDENPEDGANIDLDSQRKGSASSSDLYAPGTQTRSCSDASLSVFTHWHRGPKSMCTARERSVVGQKSVVWGFTSQEGGSDVSACLPTYRDAFRRSSCPLWAWWSRRR